MHRHHKVLGGMKYSITLASFRKIEPIEETLARLSSQNYDAVEMYGEPEEVDMRKLKDALSASRLAVCGITGMWGRISENGWRRKLLSADPGLLAASEKYVHDCIGMCSQLGGKEVNICLFADDIAGFDKTHGVISAREKDRIVARALPVIKSLCKKAADNGVKLVLEPLNRYSTPYCANASEAIAIARKVDGLGILLDTFHMNIEEDSFEDAILACRNYLAHTHFADNNRKMPGFAHIDFRSIVASLQKIGYNRYISFEPNLPDRNYDQCTRNGLEFIRQIALQGKMAVA